MPFYLFKSSRLIAYSTPQAVQPMGSTSRSHLIALPEVAFSNIELCSPKVDKYATAIVDKNHYSVPTRYTHVKVKAILHVDHVEIYYGSKRIAMHNRLYNNNQWCLDPQHYLELIQQRPQSFDTARPFVEWRKRWPPCLEVLLERFRCKQGTTKGIKDFISVLMHYKQYDANDIETAVKQALTAGVGSSTAVEYILRSGSRSCDQPVAHIDNWPRLSPPDVSVYQQIGGDL